MLALTHVFYFYMTSFTSYINNAVIQNVVVVFE